MRIRFRQTGGIVGLVRGCDIDTSDLDDADRRHLEQLVDASEIEGVIKRRAQDSRDLRQYEIRIEDDSTSRRFTCDDASLPATVRPLVSLLVGRSRPLPLVEEGEES